jgi:hypothetical protein
MGIWALHIVAPSWSGVRDIPYHLRLVLRHDAPALATLPVALAARTATVVGKLLGRDRRQRSPGAT